MKIARVGLLILGLGIIGLTGCASQPKAYLSVEKSPMKVTYIDYNRDINPKTVAMIVQQVKNTHNSNQKLNEKNEIIISYDASVSETINKGGM